MLHHTNVVTLFLHVTKQICMGSLSSASLSTGIYILLHFGCSCSRRIEKSLRKISCRTSWHFFSISEILCKRSSCFHRKSHSSQMHCNTDNSFQAGDVILTHSLYLASSVHVNLLIPKCWQIQMPSRLQEMANSKVNKKDFDVRGRKRIPETSLQVFSLVAETKKHLSVYHKESVLGKLN